MWSWVTRSLERRKVIKQADKNYIIRKKWKKKWLKKWRKGFGGKAPLGFKNMASIKE